MQFTNRSAIMMAAVVCGANVMALAAPFGAGDLAVYRVGTGSAALTNAATNVFLDEYSPAGSLVQSIALPTAASGSNNPLTASGTATSEGEISLSANGNYLLLTGYAATPGTTNAGGGSIANSATTAVLRDVGIIDGNGNIDTSTTTTAFSGNNPRSVASPDGVNLYVGGANTGIISLTDGSTGTAGTVISSTSTNNRQLVIFNGQLYDGTGSGSFRIGTVGTGVPTTGGQTLTELAGILAGTATSASASGSQVAGPYGYVFSSSTGGATPDTLYIADNSFYPTKNASTGSIEKYDLVSGTYEPDGTIPLQGVTGLIGSESLVGGVETETLYATTPTNIYELTDGLSDTLSATPVSIATAGTNEAFRGIAFTPTAVPEPASLGLMAVAATLLARRRRSRA